MNIKSVHDFLDRLHEATRDGFLRREDVFYLIDSYRKNITVFDETVLRSAADAADLRRQLALRQLELAGALGNLADERAAREQASAEAAELRRQLALRQLELAGALGNAADFRQERDAAIAETADLRRQLAECRAVAQARGETLGYAEADTDWDTPPHRPGKSDTR